MTLRFRRAVEHNPALQLRDGLRFLDPDLLADLGYLALIVGELTANAAEHQTGEAELVVRVHPDGRTDVEVVDSDPTIPTSIESAPWDLEGHRGLHLVSVISNSWGVTPEGTGKRIWACLVPPPPR